MVFQTQKQLLTESQFCYVKIHNGFVISLSIFSKKNINGIETESRFRHGIKSQKNTIAERGTEMGEVRRREGKGLMCFREGKVFFLEEEEKGGGLVCFGGVGGWGEEGVCVC